MSLRPERHALALAYAIALAVAVGLPTRAARADDGTPAIPAGGAPSEDNRLLNDDTFATHSTGTLAVDAGMVTGLPAALPTGLSTGIEAGVTRTCGCHLAYGARVSWSKVTDESAAWIIAQSDLRLRLTGALHHDVGRGSIALRLGLGGTIVHEVRDRQQGARAGLTGRALETRAIDTLPAGELEAVASLHIVGPWLVEVSGGPAADVRSGSLRGGWIAGLGIGWQP